MRAKNLVLSLMAALTLFSFSVSAEAFQGDWQLQLAKQPGPAALPPNLSLQKVITLTTDRDSSVYFLHVMFEKSMAPVGMFVQPIKPPRILEAAIEGTPFWLADIEKNQGVVLFKAQGRDILFMQGALDRGTREGRFHLRFLTNGLSMTYDTCDFVLRSNGNNYWVQNAYSGAKVTQLKVLTSFLGVDTLQGICPE